MFPSQIEFEKLRRLYLSIDEVLEPGQDALRRADEAVSHWSAEQHLAHLALANELSFGNVKSLLAGQGRLIQPEGEPVPAARQVLLAGVFPKGAEAPRMVRPPGEVQWDYLIEWLDGNRADIALLEGQSQAIAIAPGRIPHQLMGPLSASHWVRFAAMHTEHHLKIARAVLGG
jgi:hypothetical protein